MLHKKFSLAIIFAILFLSFIPLSQAQSVSGTVLDKQTRETIPFATVQIGENYGVVTNQEGDFEIKTAGFSPTDSLIFSFMGYERKAIAIKDFTQKEIYLEKNVQELDEVLVMTQQLTAMEVMQKVVENLDKNYDNSLTGFTVFNRNKFLNTPQQLLIEFKNKRKDFLDKKETEELNRIMDSLNEANKGKTSSYYESELVEIYFGKKDTAKARMIKATRLVNEEESTSMDNLKDTVLETLLKKMKSSNTFKVRTGIIGIADSIEANEMIVEEDEIDSTQASIRSYRYNLSNFGFHQKKGMGFVTDLKKYNYTIDDISLYNGEVVYKISFKPDTGLFSGNGKMSGNMYVSAETFAVLMADYQFAEGKHGTNLNLKFLFGVAFKEKGKSGKIIFQKNDYGKYIPKYIKKENAFYIFMKRPFVFKENDDNKKDRMKIKFRVTIEMEQEETQEWLVVSNKPINETAFAAFEENEGVEVQKVKKYDPEIWKDYNILAPTEAIREYEY